MNPRKVSYGLRKHIYRGQKGYLVYTIGEGRRGAFNRRVFVKTRKAAEHIRRKMKAGETITTQDFSWGENFYFDCCDAPLDMGHMEGCPHNPERL